MTGQPADRESAGFDPVLALAWDGRRHVAARAGDPGVDFALFAHTSAAQELIAVWEGRAGACVVAMPEGCRHLEAQMLRGGLPAETIAIELDDLLLPEFVPPEFGSGSPDLRAMRCAIEDGALSLSPAKDGAAAGALLCLNLSGGEAGAMAAGFSRLRVGPLHDPAGPGRRIRVSAETRPGGALLRFDGPAEAPVLAAHVFGGTDCDAGRFPSGEDASGVPPAVFAERGFRMLAPAGAEDETAALDLAPFEKGDEAIIFAPRGYLVGWSADAGCVGSRLFLARDSDGGWSARAVTAAYRRATSTAMAALGAGGALTLYEGGAAATASASDRAADLAAAIWRRSRPAPTPGTSPFESWLAAVPPAALPLARLTQAGLEAPAGLSPVLAALGPSFGVAQPMIEEVDALPARDRLALVLWFAAEPLLARRAMRSRVILPPPAGAPPAERIGALLDWCEEPELRARLDAAAALVDAGSPEGRDRQRLLRRAAALLDEGWIVYDEAAAAETVARHLSRAAGDIDESPAQRLLSGLRADGAGLAAAHAEARGLDLAKLAEWRSGLADAAQQAGQSAALAADLGQRLAALSATDILLIHRHLRAAADRLKAFDAIRRAVAALDAAADNGALAARMDRGGDALIGMTRLGSASEAAVRALTRVPAAREALAALLRFVDRHVADSARDPAVLRLRRHLQSYGCLLLAQAIAQECAQSLADAQADGQIGGQASAWRERLLSGAVEMLPACARAAAAFLPEDAVLGASLTNRLPAAP